MEKVKKGRGTSLIPMTIEDFYIGCKFYVKDGKHQYILKDPIPAEHLEEIKDRCNKGVYLTKPINQINFTEDGWKMEWTWRYIKGNCIAIFSKSTGGVVIKKSGKVLLNETFKTYGQFKRAFSELKLKYNL